MMRSLWAGVTGLQAHQIAMDVEGNNIANVNTVGFKYSRANFSDLLSQTAKIATAPQGELGGKNSMQIGLGTQVSSVTKIFKQGSIETTDKNTDLAIQGDGFFVVSPDGGSTYKYSRNGDFTFDALGNFTDSNGYIIQGWIRDDETGEIDATTPIQNITIPPGLTTPAKSTSIIDLKANLNSGDKIESKSPIYALDSQSGWVDLNDDGIMTSDEVHNEDVDAAVFDIGNSQAIYEKGEDFGTLFDSTGSAIGLEDGEGIWVSYTDAQIEAYATTTIGDVEFEINGVSIKASITGNNRAENASAIAKAINEASNETGVIATSNTDGKVTIINKNDSGTTDTMKNINFQTIGAISSGLVQSDLSTALSAMEVITAFKYTYNSSTANYDGVARTEARQFHTTEDLRDAMQSDARLNTDYEGNGFNTAAEVVANRNDGVEISINNSGQFSISNPSGDAFNEDDNDIWDATVSNTWANTPITLTAPTTYAAGEVIGAITQAGGTTITLPAGTTVPSDLAAELNAISAGTVIANVLQFDVVDDGVDVTINGALTGTATLNQLDSGSYIVGTTAITLPTGTAVSPVLTRDLQFLESTNITGGFILPPGTSLVIPEGTIVSPAQALLAPFAGNVDATGEVTTVGGITVTDANNDALRAGTITVSANATITLPIGTTLDPDDITTTGATPLPAGANYVDANDHDMNLAVTSFTDDDTTANAIFTSIIATMQGSLPLDSSGKLTQSIYAASHASSIDIYDSLGSKHTVRIDFRKAGITADGGMQWDIKISVPKPSVIDASRTDTNKNIITGTIKFGADGSLEYYTPTTISFTGNNGSSANQSVTLNLGSIGQFDGMTSFDSPSNTSGISQDGYPGGDLAGISVDETGTIIGSFTNGRSFGLAQVAMAKFSNNEGLESDGGNTFIQTSNSGDPIIGQAAVGGRGFIQASALEMSNVDLSRSLTQLIVIQRGYQANSKTITTSDQMLNTLLQLKQ